MQHARFTGLIAAPPTLMTPAGEIDPAAVARQAAALSEDGCAGAFICGTTGEGLSLTHVERRQLAERWVQAAGDRLRVIVHVGHHSQREAAQLAAHAQAIGAAGIAVVGPSYVKPTSASQLIDFCQPVAAAAPDLPLFYYHIPSVSGVRIDVLDLLTMAADRLPTLAGVKFTDEDLACFARCVGFDGGRFDMLFGRDEMLLAGLALGAKGAVGATYNFAAPHYQKIIDALEAGQLAAAQRLQRQAAELIDFMQPMGVAPAVKALVERRLGVAHGPCRAPLRALDDAQRQALFEAADRILD